MIWQNNEDCTTWHLFFIFTSLMSSMSCLGLVFDLDQDIPSFVPPNNPVMYVR